MFQPDPLSAAARQIARDQAATAEFPALLARKWQRMALSPLGYLRGAAPLFYELLQQHPELAEGPDGEGWLIGDAHLENFGAFRTSDGPGAGSVVFDANDFDEAVIGPFRWDVVRLLTSLILGGRELGSNGKQSVALCSAIFDGYIPALCEGAHEKADPPPVRRLLDKVGARTHKDLLASRTERSGAGLRFLRGDRYTDLAGDLAAKARTAFEHYVERIDPQRELARDHLVIEDVAFRIAGTGSLGGLRIAVLTTGKGQLDNRWIFDMKVEGTPAAQVLLGAPSEAPAARVLHAAQACLEHAPRMAGTTELDDRSLFVRRLLPQEDKLDLTKLRAEELPALARYLGARLGLVHRRGATLPPRAAWTDAERSRLTEHAIVIAGLHEAAYLALCKTL